MPLNFTIDFSKAFREVILVDDGARGSSGKEEMEAKLEEGWDGICLPP